MKFYVNQFYEDKLGGEQAGFPNIYPNMYIGLFTQCKAKGEGTFCGYYATEYYVDTTLLAYYQAEGGRYRPEKRISDVSTCYIHRDRMTIGSDMWTMVIEAETIEEALKKFENAEWRRRQFSDEEITVEKIIEKNIRDNARIHIYARIIVCIKDGDTQHIYEDAEVNTIDSDILSRIAQDLIISCSPETMTLIIKI